MTSPRRASADSPPGATGPGQVAEESGRSRVVVVIGHSIDAELAGRVEREIGTAEAWLVAPAFARNRIEHLVSDIDEQVDEADAALRASERELSAAGVTVAGRGTGDADPLLAIEDVLNGFPAERIVLVVHTEQESRWAESDLFEKAVERFELPIRELRIGEDGDGGVRVTETETAAASAGEEPAELRPANYSLPPIPVSDAVGLGIGILGTVVLAILAASAPGDYLEWPASAQLALAIYSALVNLGHAFGLLLMDSVGFHRGPEKFFAWLSLIGTPIAILASVLLAVTA